MENKNFAKQAGAITGKLVAAWIGATIGVIVLTIPTKLVWIAVQWCWNLI